jgi:hypothetical protein
VSRADVVVIGLTAIVTIGLLAAVHRRHGSRRRVLGFDVLLVVAVVGLPLFAVHQALSDRVEPNCNGPAGCASVPPLAEANAAAIPAGAEPPDPCRLLSAAELQTALNIPSLHQSGSTEPVNGLSEYVTCNWSEPASEPPRMAVALTVTTRALAESAYRHLHDNLLPSVSLNLLDVWMETGVGQQSDDPDAVRRAAIADLGDTAYVVEYGGGFNVNVLAADRFIEVNIASTEGSPYQDETQATALARLVLSRFHVPSNG